MNQITQSFVNLDDTQIITLIETARERLVYMAPGLSLEVAQAITERWQMLGNDHVKVILDVDSEVVRLGYGTLEGLEFVQQSAVQLQTTISCQPGIRIGLLIVDQTTIVFSPKPLSIEASHHPGFQPNAIFLEETPVSILDEIGWGPSGSEQQAVGRGEVTDEQLAETKKDLQENPPQQFDITRTLQVFNSRIEFVEVKVTGCSISRKTATIPPDLLAFIIDEDTRRNLHSSYHLVREGSELSGKKITLLRKQLVDRWLVSIPDFGAIVLRKNKKDLEEGIEQLKQDVAIFQVEIHQKLQTEIDHNCDLLVRSLLPLVLQNPPDRWLKQIGKDPTDQDIEQMLAFELRKAFGTADELIQRMEVQVIFKGVTYEMLNDPRFLKAVRKAIPTLPIIFDEFGAARAIQEPLF